MFLLNAPVVTFWYTCGVQADGSVLRRLNAVPDRYMFSPNYSDHINNGSAFSELTGRDDFTLGSLRLDSLEVSDKHVATSDGRWHTTVIAQVIDLLKSAPDASISVVLLVGISHKPTVASAGPRDNFCASR